VTEVRRPRLRRGDGQSECAQDGCGAGALLKDFSNTELLIQQALFKIQSLADEANQEVMKRVA